MKKIWIITFCVLAFVVGYVVAVFVAKRKSKLVETKTTEVKIG
jgi:glycopeptide antibiotics resistance protein